jgi:type II secretory pathway pseudopilin PulG
MRKQNSNDSAFTLLEVLLAAIIFVITIGGLFVTLDAVRAPVIAKENALTAAIFGKQVLEALRTQVNTQTFYNACSTPVPPALSCPDFSLYLGLHQVPLANLPAGLTWPASLTANNLNGNPAVLSYTVFCADNSVPSGYPLACSSADIARGVTLNITSS